MERIGAYQREREREREIPIGGKNKGDRTVGLLLPWVEKCGARAITASLPGLKIVRVISHVCGNSRRPLSAVSYAIFLLCRQSMETRGSQWVLESNSNRARDRPGPFQGLIYSCGNLVTRTYVATPATYVKPRCNVELFRGCVSCQVACDLIRLICSLETL